MIMSTYSTPQGCKVIENNFQILVNDVYTYALTILRVLRLTVFREPSDKSKRMCPILLSPF